MWGLPTSLYRTSVDHCFLQCVNTFKLLVLIMPIQIPCSSANPFIGTLDVPVTNCSNLALSSTSKFSTAYYKVSIVNLSCDSTWDIILYLPKPYNDIISRLIAICISRIPSPVLNIDLSKTTQEVLMGQSIINELSVRITSSNLDVITHICLPLDESYLYRLAS